MVDLGTRDHSLTLQRYDDVRALTEIMAAPLSAEDQTVQSMPDVSPTKWHRAHTTWFFETFLLREYGEGYRCFDPAYGHLFNSYYEAIGDRHPRAERGLISRPGIDEIARYRHHVDEAMADLVSGSHEPRVGELVELGLHHEQQHQELLLMDIKHVLSVNPTRPAYGEVLQPTPPAPDLRFIEHGGGVVEIGHGGIGFGFDNEFPRHQILIPPFALARGLVTAGQWQAFMADGGYERPELWLSDGWAKVREQHWRAPLYWSEIDGQWDVFTMGGPRALTDDEPVCHISYYEADAFARWSGARLPSEAEWECLAGPDTGARFLDLSLLHPVDASGSGGLAGEVWQWTSSSYGPYPGFRPAAGAVGEYNGKFMVNQYVLRGGSCFTPIGHSRSTYRNFFPAGARWAMSGLRLAKDVDD